MGAIQILAVGFEKNCDSVELSLVGIELESEMNWDGSWEDFI